MILIILAVLAVCVIAVMKFKKRWDSGDHQSLGLELLVHTVIAGILIFCAVFTALSISTIPAYLDYSGKPEKPFVVVDEQPIGNLLGVQTPDAQFLLVTGQVNGINRYGFYTDNKGQFLSLGIVDSNKTIIIKDAPDSQSATLVTLESEEIGNCWFSCYDPDETKYELHVPANTELRDFTLVSYR